jgi:hypothetical protein
LSNYDAKEKNENLETEEPDDGSVIENVPETHERMNSVYDYYSDNDSMPPLAIQNHWNNDNNLDSVSDNKSVTNMVSEKEETVNSINLVSNANHDKEWLVDSGATGNVTKSNKFMENVKACNLRITVGNGDKEMC